VLLDSKQDEIFMNLEVLEMLWNYLDYTLFCYIAFF